MRPPKGLTSRERWDIERFAYLTGIGPLFDMRPKHHGQHSMCCAECRKWLKTAAKKAQADEIKQPYEPKPSRFAA